MDKTVAKEDFYTPGVCNINPKEVKYRKNVGHFFAGLTVVIAGLILAFGASYWFMFATFITVWLAAISYLQAKNNFCVSYASSGKFNSSAEYAKTAEVENEDDKQKDKSKSKQMYLQATIHSALTTTLLLIISILTQ